MINERDLKTIKGVLGTDNLKELTIRLFNDALLSSTMITAPEIRKCLKEVENKLTDKKERKVVPDRKAE